MDQLGNKTKTIMKLKEMHRYNKIDTRVKIHLYLYAYLLFVKNNFAHKFFKKNVILETLATYTLRYYLI